jgi:hypothetical protein
MKIGHFRRVLLAVGLAGLGVAQAATVVSVSGPNDINTAVTTLGNSLAVGFSLGSSYTNGSVAASLIAFGGGGTWNLDAYLTTRVGPGTTAADVVAHRAETITIPGSSYSTPYNITPFTVFSGLNLNAGSYYLILAGTYGTANVSWVETRASVTTTALDAGASVLATALMAAGDPFLPASGFIDISGDIGNSFWYDVTGDRVLTGTPEPTSMALCVVPLLSLAGRRLLRRASNQRK